MSMAKLKLMSDRVDDWFEDHPIKIAIVVAIFLLATMGYGIFGPDNGPGTVRKRLREAGYDVTAIEFERIENTNDLVDGKLYRSSSKIEYAPGVFVDEWNLRNLGFGRNSYWTVTPYPELPKPVDLHLRLSVSQEEYERLSMQAKGMSVEEYLEQAIDNIVSDT